jgi:hypothetical protein
MKQHLMILEMAAQGKLPDKIDTTSDLSVTSVEQLVDAGYLTATDASSCDGAAYLEPKITLAGREYLDELRARIREDEMETEKQNGRPLDAVIGMTDVIDVWEEIKTEYDVSKMAFGKRINFVKDQFKRKVIFRDVEHAFILAHDGFNKAAVILAGSVIEELLRLYPEQKKVVPAQNTLDSYIKTCDERGLLKGAIHKLADSVRQFRNIVHLEREISSRYTISKATAKGAVSSIFTIANDFEA